MAPTGSNDGAHEGRRQGAATSHAGALLWTNDLAVGEIGREQDHRIASGLIDFRILEDEGLTVFLDRWYLVPGHSWPKALEEALKNCQAVSVFLGPHAMGGWQQRERDLALNRQTRDSTFPVIPVLLPGADPALEFLNLNTWVDMRDGIDDPLAIAVLVAAARGQAPGPELQEQMNATLATICPYRGMRAFREEDAPLFFGREAFTEKLVKEVTRRSMIAVVGASGSGKSSVVRAGLVPHVRKGIDKDVWDVAT
ncbi:MAG: toll/interleukin-1 receptor domain-containing protein, partial [SAR324 cluster bacterium]|nr:toll/interleukin-1 receptor domain-containing protein [SAR324 cluster bacterium]